MLNKYKSRLSTCESLWNTILLVTRLHWELKASLTLCLSQCHLQAISTPTQKHFATQLRDYGTCSLIGDQYISEGMACIFLCCPLDRLPTYLSQSVINRARWPVGLNKCQSHRGRDLHLVTLLKFKTHWTLMILERKCRFFHFFLSLCVWTLVFCVFAFVD